MTPLYVVKTITGDHVATELQEIPGGFVFVNPFILDLDETTVNTRRFLQGTTDTTFSVARHYIATMGNADNFIRRLYGSTLFNTLIQEAIEKEGVEFNSKEEFSAFVRAKLTVERQEILQKFGMMDSGGDDEENNSNNKVLH